MLFAVPAPPPPPLIATEISYEAPTSKDIATYSLFETLFWPWLDEYFRKLTSIQRDVLYTLPSWNTFKITYKGILFFRKGKQELRQIEAKNKWASLRVDRLEYEQNSRKIRITAIKYGIPFKQDPQFLSIDEVVKIFTHIESNTTYTRPNNKPTWEPYKLILQVEKEK